MMICLLLCSDSTSFKDFFKAELNHVLNKTEKKFLSQSKVHFNDNLTTLLSAFLL